MEDVKKKVCFTISKKQLLEEGILLNPEDFNDFVEFVRDREQYFFEEDREMLSEYAYLFYDNKED